MTETARPGWYRQGERQVRWWDGEAWTDQVRPIPEAAAEPPPSSAALEPRRSSPGPGPLIIIGGAAAVAVGCFLPWIKATAPLVGTITKSGVDNGGDGVIALGLAGVLALLGYRARDGASTKIRKLGGFLVLLLLGALLVYEVVDISHRFADVSAASDLVSTSYGSGLVLMGAGIVAGIVGWVQLPWPGRRTHPIPTSHPSGE